MNKVKYRAWDKEEKRMAIVDSLHFYSDKELKIIYIDSVKNGKTKSVLIEEVELMQYTGLRDKNKKEIYFDDVIKFSFMDREGEHYKGTALVTESMNYGAAILYDFNNKDDSADVWAVTCGGMVEDIWEDDSLWEFEIIGNIYENPELLK